ncbi:MAG: hypothetical protein ACI9CE_003506 [Flavobacterium sp.]|jgi:hypothetical protein
MGVPISCWPAFNNLNQLVKRDRDWRPQLKTIQSGLSVYNGEPCVDLPDIEAAMNEIIAAVVSSGSSDSYIEIKAIDDVVQGCVRFRRDGQI